MQPHSTTLPTPSDVICPNCGIQFRSRLSSKGRRTRFCSHECHLAWGRSNWEDRFWKKVNKSSDPDGCWIWTGATNGRGYGNFKLPSRLGYAHRISFELAYGPIPEGFNACHSCDVNYASGDISYRRCVRPDHLFLGTTTDNIRDCVAKGRNYKGIRVEMKGIAHPMARLTERQVIEIRQLYATGRFTLQGLGDTFNVSFQTISLIVNHKTWKHLP